MTSSKSESAYSITTWCQVPARAARDSGEIAYFVIMMTSQIDDVIKIGIYVLDYPSATPLTNFERVGRITDYGLSLRDVTARNLLSP